mgnify:CR=1 FL=1
MGSELSLHFVEQIARLTHFFDRSEQLEPIANQVKPIFPPFDRFFVLVLAAEDCIQEQVRVV